MESKELIIAGPKTEHGGLSVTQMAVYTPEHFFKLKVDPDSLVAPYVYTVTLNGRQRPRLLTKKRLKAEYSHYARTDMYRMMMKAQFRA